MNVVYAPEDDGFTHINIYSKAQTELGQAASNFQRLNFVVPGFGSFASMEAFYYYVSTGSRHDHLRRLSGFLAKQEGQLLSTVKRNDFDEVMRLGIRSKYLDNKELFDNYFVKHSTGGEELPFTHYYVMGSERTVVVPQGNTWLVDEWESIRSEYFSPEE